MSAFDTVLLGRGRKQLNDHWDFICKLEDLTIEVIDLEAAIALCQNSFDGVVPSHSWSVTYVKERRTRCFSKPMQLVGKYAVKKTATFLQLLAFQKVDEIAAGGLSHPTLLNNDTDLSVVCVGLKYIGLQPTEHRTNRLNAYDLGINRSLHREAIPSHGKLDKLCMTFSLSSVRPFHHRDRPRRGSDRSQAGDQRLIIRHELSPRITHAARYSRNKKSGGNCENHCREDPTATCLWHPFSPATATRTALGRRSHALISVETRHGPCRWSGEGADIFVLNIHFEGSGLGQVKGSKPVEPVSQFFQAALKKHGVNHHGFDAALRITDSLQCLAASRPNFEEDGVCLGFKVARSSDRIVKIDRKLTFKKLIGFLHLRIANDLGNSVREVLDFGRELHLAPNVFKAGPRNDAFQISYCLDDGGQEWLHTPTDLQAVCPKRQRHHLAMPKLAFLFYFSGKSQSALRLSDRQICGADCCETSYQRLKVVDGISPRITRRNILLDPVLSEKYRQRQANTNEDDQRPRYLFSIPVHQKILPWLSIHEWHAVGVFASGWVAK